MNTKTVDIEEAGAHLAELLVLAQQGDEVIIAEGNTPLAKLVPIHKPTKQRIPGLHRGAMHMHDDFNDPLPDSFWLGEE